jgi:ATP-dependent Clp protease adaptor protein ClpS
MSYDTKIKENINTKLRIPKLYKVILNNDDYTTMEFVIEVLVEVFHKTPTEATKIMMDVHEKGRGIVGLYTYDIAHTKALQVEEMATQQEYPLSVSIEEE